MSGSRDSTGHSPQNLFQETYAGQPWRLLCCVIMLNQTNGLQLEPVHRDLFDRWPDAMSMAIADHAEVTECVRTLGLQNRRARQLIRMSAHYAFLWDGRDPRDLPGIGGYGSDSYRIFIRRELSVEATDKELKKYLEWTREQRR